MMKSAIVSATLLSGSVAVSSLLAQGLFQWGNNIQFTVRAPIYGVDPANPTETRMGNTAAGLPAGTQTYAGPLLAGTRFTAAIYTSDNPIGMPANNTHIQVATFGSGPNAGLITSHVTSDPNRPPGTAGVCYQFRAWDNQGGTVTSWAQVMTAGGVIASGTSDVYVFAAPLSNGSMGQPNTVLIRSFQLTIVPEPSLIALSALGLGALLFHRHRQSSSTVFLKSPVRAAFLFAHGADD